MNKIIKNYIYNSIYQVIALVTPIITMPYIARVLGANGVGINSYITSISTIFICIGLLGLDKYASREIAYKREDKNELNKSFSQLLVLRIIMIIIVSVIYIVYSCFSEYKVYLLIQLVYVIGSLLDISWLYHGMEEFKITVTRSIILKIVNIICLFVFIKQPSDLWKYILINGLLTFLANITLYYKMKNYVKLKKVPIKDIMKHLPLTLKVFIPQIAVQIYLQLGKIMINIITSNNAEIAYYDQADKIVKLPLALITALSTVMLPRISNEFKKNNNMKIKEYISKSLSFALFLGIPIMIGICGISDTVVPWLLGEEFMPVIEEIRILSPIIIAICITNVIGDQYLMAINNTKVLTISYLIGATVNFGLNLIFIKKWSYIGAAISMVITEIVIVSIQMLNSRNVINVNKLIKGIWKYIVASLTMLIPIILLRKICSNMMVVTFLQVLSGIFMYIVMLLILKDQFLNYIKEQIIEKKIRALKEYKK